MGHRDRFDGQFPKVLVAAQRGERWALEQIYRALGPVVAGYLRTQGAVEPEDLTSEVFVAVLRKIAAFRGDEPAFRSWVFMIAHRRLLDERRRLRRRPPPDPLDHVPDTPASDDVEALVAQIHDVDRLRKLCQLLRPDQRDVLLLRFVAGLSVDDVAAALGKTRAAVKGLQHRGFAALAQLAQTQDASL